MKFSCEQSTLVRMLNIVSKAVSQRTTIPILKGILLEAQGNGLLKMAASDLEISIEEEMEVFVEESGEVVVPAKLFSDIIRKLPSGTVEIEEKGESIHIRCGSSEFNLIGSGSDEFPKIMLKEEGERISLNRESLKEMIRKTSFAASVDESRGVITGVLMEMKENELSMAALDGYRMAVNREEMKTSGKESIVIPARTLNEIGKIIGETDFSENEIEIFMSEKRAVFLIDDIKVVTRLLEGEFVRYQDILPKESAVKVRVNRSDFLDAVERASLMARIGKHNLIKIEIKDQNMTIYSRSEEGSGKEEIAVSKEGNDLTIGFNSRYIIDSLKVIGDERIIMLFNTPVSPCLIRPTEGEKYDYLILPVRINS